MLRRNRNDGFFPSDLTNGREKGIRRWLLMHYGEDPQAPDEVFQAIHDKWRGFESLVSSYLYYDHVMTQKEERAET
jgi:hypothetical protein